MNSTQSEWLGRQTPRLSCLPTSSVSVALGDDAVQLAAWAGLILDPWQEWVLRHALGTRDDGGWAAFEVGLVVGRQNGKNAVLEARELAELFLVAPRFGPRLVIHAAHQFKTALEHFRRIKRRILDTPELLEKVKGPVRRGIPAGIRDSHGEESIELVDGSRLLFAARTSSGGQGRGFTADLLAWDEAMNLPDSVVGSVLPTLSAKTLEIPGVQVWYTGSAVNQQTMPYGVQLARIRERGIAGDDPELFYAEWSIDPDEYQRNPTVIDDPAYWAQANPGQGRRIAVEHIVRERRGAMPFEEFLVERAGIGDWPPTSDEARRVIPSEMWNALADPASRIEKDHAFGLDIDPGQAWATLAAAGQRQDGLWHIGVVEHARGIGWIVEKCKHYLLQHPGAQLVVDPRADLADLLAELEEQGIRPVRVEASDVKDACGGLFRAVVEKQLRYMPPQPELDRAVAGAKTKPLLDAWKWDKRDSNALITPLVACTLALWGARAGAAPHVFSLAEFAAENESVQAPRPEPGSVTFVPLT